MALQTQVVSLPIVGGKAEDVDPNVLEPGGWADLRNVIYDKNGALRVRPGYGLMPDTTLDGSTLPRAELIDTTSSGELVAIGEPGDERPPVLWSYSPSAQDWVERDGVCPASMTRAPVVRSSWGLIGGHICYANNREFAVYAILDAAAAPAGILLRVRDVISGAVLQDDIYLAAGVAAHYAFVASTRLVVVYQDGNSIRFVTVDTTTLAVSVAATIFTAVGVLGSWDACHVSGTTIAIAAVDSANSAVQFHVGNINSATGAILVATTVAATNVVNVAIGSNGTKTCAAWSDAAAPATTVHCCQLAAVSLVAVFSDIVLVSNWDVVLGVATFTDSQGNVWTMWRGSEPFAAGQDGTWAMMADGTGATGALRTLRHCQYASRPFEELTTKAVYAFVTDYSSSIGVPAGGHSLVCLSDENLATVPPTLCGTHSAVDSVITPVGAGLRVSYLGARRYVAPVFVRTDATRVGMDGATLDFEPVQADLWRSSQVQGLLLQSGGMLASYDGQSVVESGFVQRPRIVTTRQVVGPGAIPAGVYGYVAIYAWHDSKGNLHVSAPSDMVLVTVAAPLTEVQLDITYTNLTRRGDLADGATREAQIWLYRTLDNNEARLYRAVVNPVINVRNAAFATLSDTANDTTMVTSNRGLLYTDGGVLEALLPPPSRSLCTTKGRAWLVSSEDDRSVWYSQLLVQGEAPRWHPGLSLRVSDSPDGLTAVAPLDDKVLAFTPSRIYWIAGEGPADTGTNGSFGGPYLLTSSAGCVDPRSVVAFEGGVLFQSKGGFYLVNRGLQLLFAGAPVEDTLAAYPLVRSAVLDAARSRIVYMCSNVAGNATVMLVYDYLRTDAQGRGTWLVWSITGTAEQRSTALWNGLHAWSGADGVALEGYGASPWQDTGSDITAWVETPWYKPAGIDGYQRTKHVLVNMRQEAPHDFTFTLWNDYDYTTPTQTQTINAGVTSTLTGLPVERIDLHVARQKCSAIKIKMAFAAPSDGDPPVGTPARGGATITGLSLEIGTKKGRAKLPADNRR